MDDIRQDVSADLALADIPASPPELIPRMFPRGITTLPDLFRARAKELAGYLAPAEVPWEQAASLLETAITTAMTEPLTLENASTESGFTIGHLRRLLGLEQGYPAKLPNAGTPEVPLLLRCHLPRKPGAGVADHEVEVAPARPRRASSRMQVARAVASED
jgi:hypothetical protein